jgi:hypothetical protein
VPFEEMDHPYAFIGKHLDPSVARKKKFLYLAQSAFPPGIRNQNTPFRLLPHVGLAH